MTETTPHRLAPLGTPSPKGEGVGVRGPRAIAWWLMICAVMIFVMVMLGGATRLTDSGLSMVEWKPLTVLPPMTDAAWAAEFERYQQFPQFIKKFSWMTVDDFKGIYALEFTHRLWGRLIGFVFALPFLWFVARRAVDRSLGWKLAGLFVLGGLQGVIGWFMVASGLQDRPDVSQYRLAAHLITAVILYGAIIWVALDLFDEGRMRIATHASFVRLVHILPFAVMFVMLVGAFVAGLDAGLIYNTFPLMDGQWLPPGGMDQAPWYGNLFENVATVQFEHRMVAVALVIFVAVVWFQGRTAALTMRARKLLQATVGMALIQASLGISTLLLVVPVPLALAHQTGALILFTLSVCLAHEVRSEQQALASEPLVAKAAE